MVDAVGARRQFSVKWEDRKVENVKERGERRIKGL